MSLVPITNSVQDADIYIFDDILAELSHSMVCQLLENALLSPLLAEKTRVLVSNHLPVAKAADLLLLMEGGTIHQGGSWEQVLQVLMAQQISAI